MAELEDKETPEESFGVSIFFYVTCKLAYPLCHRKRRRRAKVNAIATEAMHVEILGLFLVRSHKRSLFFFVFFSKCIRLKKKLYNLKSKPEVTEMFEKSSFFYVTGFSFIIK